MPEIARFYGIIIRMFAEPGAPHHRPHFHAYYQNLVGIYAIDDIERIGGELPQTQERLVRGLSSTKLNSSRTGAGCKLASGRSGSRRFAKWRTL